MSKVITTTGRSISTVTAEIVAISNQAAQMAYMSMVEIGRRLVEVKELVPHGEWGDYLKNEVKFSHRTANNFMQIYERSLTGNNSQTFANLGYSHIVKLLSLPDEELEEFAESNDVQNMSVRQLDQAIKERDAARDQAAEFRQKAQEATLDAKAARAKAEAAKKTGDRLQTEIDRLEKALTTSKASAAAAQAQLAQLQENPQIPERLMNQIAADALSQAEKEVREKLDTANADIVWTLSIIIGAHYGLVYIVFTIIIILSETIMATYTCFCMLLKLKVLVLEECTLERTPIRLI